MGIEKKDGVRSLDAFDVLNTCSLYELERNTKYIKVSKPPIHRFTCISKGFLFSIQGINLFVHDHQSTSKV